MELGITLVEVMPVNAFNGRHGWGYDGVLWGAVQEEYGGPAAYQAFVDACHRRGLGVIQDVVYNHLGPSGNYLPEFGPYIADGPSNTWGEALNLDGENSDEVRRYIIDNALMWLREYHVDGLRLDAVHALSDTRATHLLEELAVEVAALSAFLNRPLSLIAESDLNNPRLITTRDGGGYGLTGQWSDDFHHALYVSLTGDTTGYYADFDSLDALGKVFENGFFHDGTHSSFRGRAARAQDRHPADAHLAAGRLLRQPRPDRQPGRRPATVRQDQRPAAGPRRLRHAAQPVHADDLHGRGVGRLHPLAVLHRPSRTGAGREGGHRTPGGVRPDGLGSRPRCPIPRTRRPSNGPSSTGTSSTDPCTRSCWS